jgi:hypothetical protein
MLQSPVIEVCFQHHLKCSNILLIVLTPDLQTDKLILHILNTDTLQQAPVKPDCIIIIIIIIIYSLFNDAFSVSQTI